MELQWNFEQTITGATTPETTNDFGTELKRRVTSMFHGSQDYHDLNLVSKYQQVLETMSFMFEDYRQRFEEIITQRMGDLTPEQHQVEATLFCAWLSIEVMTALSKQVIRT